MRQAEPRWFKRWRIGNDRAMTEMRAANRTQKAIATEMTAMKTQLDLLVGCTPEAFESFAAPFTAPSVNPLQDQISGTSATYSFVEHGGSFFAVGAAHCALFLPKHYKLNLSFVQLPESVLQCGVEAIYRSQNLTAVRSVDQHWQNDFIVAKLKSKPLGSGCAPWPMRAPGDTRDLGPTFGSSSSGPVTGTNLTYDVNTNSFTFLQGSGEPGHSGTLMWAIRSKLPVGVYFGCRGQQKNMRFRGVIVPVPPLENLVRMPVVASKEKIPRTYLTRIGPWNVKTVGGVDWQEVDNFPGVFVTGGTSFVGKTVVGACRSR